MCVSVLTYIEQHLVEMGDFLEKYKLLSISKKHKSRIDFKIHKTWKEQAKIYVLKGTLEFFIFKKQISLYYILGKDVEEREPYALLLGM